MLTQKLTWSAENSSMMSAGLVVLDEDSVSAPTMQKLLGPDVSVQVARVALPSAAAKNPASELDASVFAAAASLLPSSPPSVIGFACTTGAIQVGSERLKATVAKAASGAACVDPIQSAFVALRYLGVERLAVLSPYRRELSEGVARAFTVQGFQVRRLSYFNAVDSEIVSISERSILEAARHAVAQDAEALFLSCTGMRSVPLIDALEAEIGMPVLSSLQVMAWRMAAELGIAVAGPGALFAKPMRSR